ncbi:MAG: RES family NAD+ phosphorylase [Gammaproteobacteria bacterium]|nr:RES family NAD+ phosphorylase [Gammaproteobacteria bacterium]
MSNLDIHKITQTNFNNQKCYRLIPSKFPPIYLFEDVADHDEFEALYNIQKITNPRLQEELGDISLISQQDRVYGIMGASYIMAAFTHINPIGSRFSDGTFGIYYASENLKTAIQETSYHRQLFLWATNEPAQEIDMRCLGAYFSANLLNICDNNLLNTELYSKNSYKFSQEFGIKTKIAQANGIYYHSVRSQPQQGKNFALLKPKIFKKCIQESHYGYIWDGTKITDIYEKKLLSLG